MKERMNGKDFLNRLAREKMPDPEQTRDQVRTRYEAEGVASAQHGSFFKRLQWRMAVLIAAASLIFAGAATAVGIATSERIEHVDVGGSAKIILLPYDCQEAREYIRSNLMTMSSIYISPNANSGRHFLGALTSTNDALRMNEELAGQLFLADGSLFPYVFVVGSAGLFQGDARGHALFDANGNEIYEIIAWRIDNGPLELQIETVVHHEMRNEWENRNASFEDAVTALGVTFTLPSMVADTFHPPTFHVINLHTIRGWVQVRYIELERNNDTTSSRDIVINIEPLRTDDTNPFTHIIPGNAEALENAGTTVYRITAYRRSPSYVWAHNGLAFELSPPSSGFMAWGSQYLFTDEQIYQIIAEMLQ